MRYSFLFLLFWGEMKKLFLYAAVLIVALALIFAWLIFGPATNFEAKSKYLYIKGNGDIKEQVQEQLSAIIGGGAMFNFVASQAGMWGRLKPGRFEIKKGESVYNIVRTLRNNTQSPVKLVINKLRIKEDLAKLLAKNFAIDSAIAIQFLNSNDSLMQLGADTNTLFTSIIPDTYLFNWTTPLPGILKRVQREGENFWNKNNRLEKTAAAGLTSAQVYIIASIVEEETNKADDKGKIASVYINRMNKGMPLAADPTIKYALKDFSIKRIYYYQLKVVSPYNTYINKGLPPGPVCTPSQNTLDAVINAPKTDFLFFVATSDFSGYSHFSNNFAEHDRYAKEYQKALNELMAKKQKP